MVPILKKYKIWGIYFSLVHFIITAPFLLYFAAYSLYISDSILLSVIEYPILTLHMLLFSYYNTIPAMKFEDALFYIIMGILFWYLIGMGVGLIVNNKKEVRNEEFLQKKLKKKNNRKWAIILGVTHLIIVALMGGRSGESLAGFIIIIIDLPLVFFVFFCKDSGTSGNLLLFLIGGTVYWACIGAAIDIFKKHDKNTQEHKEST